MPSSRVRRCSIIRVTVGASNRSVAYSRYPLSPDAVRLNDKVRSNFDVVTGAVSACTSAPARTGSVLSDGIRMKAIWKIGW